MLCHQPISNDFILQCHDISQLLPAFETDTLPESYQLSESMPMYYNYHNHHHHQQHSTSCGAMNIKLEAPIQSQVFYSNMPHVEERQTQCSAQATPTKRITVKQEPPMARETPVYNVCPKQERPFNATNQNNTLVLRAQPLLQRVMGKSKKPYLYAVCLAAILKLGVHMENDKFLVFNDAVFMTAISVFSQYKQKRPRDTYGAYKSIKRWAQVLEKRRKGNSWRFAARPEKHGVWHQAFAEIESILKIQAHVNWTCPRTGRDLCIDITSKEFQAMICGAARL